MKADFKFDPEFPVIDGVGHGDEIGFFNVKGGGCTNTTLLDGGYFDGFHHAIVSRSPALLSTSQNSCRVGPNIYLDQFGVPQAGSPDCLNVIFEGDSQYARCGDRVLLNRIEVSGTVFRSAGHESDPIDGQIGAMPKCFVCLVLDNAANGSALASDPIFDFGGGLNSAATEWVSSVPLRLDTSPAVPDKRFSILAYDVIDFSDVGGSGAVYVRNPRASTSIGGPLPVAVETVVDSYENFYEWFSVSRGFRFDVDLNDVLCSFASGTGAGIAYCLDRALHVYALCFNGVDYDGYTPDGFGSLYVNYYSRLSFADFLSPRAFVPAGADGGAIPDEEVPMAFLADASAALGGDDAVVYAAEPRRKRTKASEGFFNFRPRGDPALLQFPDDFEFSRLKSGKRSDSSRPSTGRRWKAHRYDDNEDYLAREGDRGGKRGKY